MARITWTHGYDLLFRLASLFGGITAIGLIADSKDWMGWIPGALVLIIIFLVLEPYNWVLGWLYVHHHLGISLTKEEAKAVEFLFNGSAGGKWYKLTPKPELSLDQRKQYLFQLATQVAREKGYREPKFPAPTPPSPAPRFPFDPPAKTSTKPVALYCHRCGNALIEQAAFCSTCGVKVPH